MTATDLTLGLFKLKFHALGTQCMVQFRAPSVEAAKTYRAAALDWIWDFEQTWSRFRPDSLLSKINAAAGVKPISLTPEQSTIIDLCKYTYDLTGGILDPTSFPLTRLWDRASKSGRIPNAAEITHHLSLVSWPEVEHYDHQIFLPRKGMALEIGSFGKEYAADQILMLARKHGITSALIDLGRDLVTLGSPPQSDYWIVGAEDAHQPDAPLQRLALSGQALATSGNGRRFRTIAGEKFGHIIDSRTGYPVSNDVLTTTCLADDCLTAGLLSTTACIIGAKKGLTEINRHLRVEAILQTTTETLYSQNIHRHILSS